MRNIKKNAEGGRQKAEGWRADICLLFTAFCFLMMLSRVDASAFDLIISGSGGEDVYVERFADWGQRLRKALITQCGRSEDQVILLNETGQDADGVSSLEGVRQATNRLIQRVTSRDDVFVFLIGHGSFRRQVAKLNVPGPDLTADDLGVLLKTLPARRIVIVNGASMSAPFINALSQKDWILCTSTRSLEQRNATRFMGFLVQALEDGSADQNRDERISVLELCRQASSLTEAWFLGEGLIMTENALLDDNGDGRGTRVIDIVEGEGDLARRCFLQDFKVPAGVDPNLVESYSRAIDAVQMVINKKTSMDSVAYYERLEAQLLKAARLNREIRGKK